MAKTALGRLIERRANPLENPEFPLTSSNLLEMLGGQPSVTGVPVSEDRALTLVAVQACVRLIAGTVASLPLKAYRKTDKGRDELDRPVLEQPNANQTNPEYLEQVLAHLLLWGNAFVYKVRSPVGTVNELWPIHPRRVQVMFAGELTEEHFNIAVPPGEKLFIVQDIYSSRSAPMTSSDLMHIPGLGYDGRAGLPPIRMAREALGVALAAEEYTGRFFGNGSQPSGIISAKEPLDDGKAGRIKDRWKAMHSGLVNAHEIAVLDNQATFQPISIPPGDAQLLQSRQWSVTEIARLFGVPPHMIGDVARSTSWGTGIEQQTLGFVKFTLLPWLRRIEERYTREVVLARDTYAEFNVDGLLRGDHANRANFYMSGIQNGWMKRREARDFENLPFDPDPSLDDFIISSNQTIIGDDGTLYPAKTGATSQTLVNIDTGEMIATPKAGTDDESADTTTDGSDGTGRQLALPMATNGAGRTNGHRRR